MSQSQLCLDDAVLFKLLSNLLGGIPLLPEFDPHINAVGNASSLDLLAFHKATLQCAQVYKTMETMEADIAKLSLPDLEIRAVVLPGYGFSSGMWIEKDHWNFLSDCLLIFIAGFNDARWGRSDEGRNWVCDEVDKHIKWYKQCVGCKLVFVEPNDHHGNNVPWLSQYFQACAAKDPDRISVATTAAAGDGPSSCRDARVLYYPQKGWSSESYTFDKYHLTKQGFAEWLPSLQIFACALAKYHGFRRVMFLTDSTFAPHDYSSFGTVNRTVNVLLMQGEMLSITVDVTDTVRDLKTKVSRQCGIRPEKMLLQLSGRELLNEHLISDYKMREAALIFMIPNCSPASASDDARNMYFVSNNFLHPKMDRAYPCSEHRKQTCGGERYDEPCNGEYGLALSVMSRFDNGHCGWLRNGDSSGAWAVSYHGNGLHLGATMAEDAFLRCKGYSGIYSTPDLELAFTYAETCVHDGRVFRAVLQNRVNPDHLTKIQTSQTEFWVVEKPEDIRPCSIILREECGFDKEEVDMASEVFKSLDDNKDGVLDKAELKAMMQYLNKQPSRALSTLADNLVHKFSPYAASASETRFPCESENAPSSQGQLVFDDFKAWYILQRRNLKRLRNPLNSRTMSVLTQNHKNEPINLAKRW